MASIPVRDGISTKTDIAAALSDSLTGISGWISTQPESQFTTGPSGRWTAGQHLEHLVRSVQPLTLGMSMPKLVLGIALGTMKRPSMSYAELAEKYEGVLDAGGKAGGRYVPPAVPAAKKSTLLRAHRQQLNKLLVKMDRFTEAELDHYGAKHPLIGMLSLRELLFFTVHHHDHHLHTLQRDYTA